MPGPLLDFSTGQPDFGLIHIGDQNAIEDAIRVLWFDIIALSNTAGLRLTPLSQMLNGKVTDTNPGGNVNDADPGSSLVLQFNVNPGINVTGFRNGKDGRVLFIYNRGVGSIVLQHNNAGSAAGNRLWNQAQADLTVAQYSSAIYYYSGIQSQWNQVHLA